MAYLVGHLVSKNHFRPSHGKKRQFSITTHRNLLPIQLLFQIFNFKKLVMIQLPNNCRFDRAERRGSARLRGGAKKAHGADMDSQVTLVYLPLII